MEVALRIIFSPIIAFESGIASGIADFVWMYLMRMSTLSPQWISFFLEGHLHKKPLIKQHEHLVFVLSPWYLSRSLALELFTSPIHLVIPQILQISVYIYIYIYI